MTMNDMTESISTPAASRARVLFVDDEPRILLSLKAPNTS
jgi:hypothetical protein